MKINLLFILLFLTIFTTHSQELQVQKLNSEEIEALFLKNNLELIAEKYNVDIADAAIIQARLWDNPALSIGDINLWSTQSQRDDIRELTTSSFAKNTEFSIELSQLIQTANKRGKLIQREKISKEIALQDFEEVLRGLKTELRRSVCEIQYSQSYLNILLNQSQSVNQLVEAYKKQVSEGNIARSELFRLQSSLLELENEINDVRIDLAEQEKILKILLNMDAAVKIDITGNPYIQKTPEDILLPELFRIADESRPDMKRQKLQMQFFQKSLSYEKSLKIPDITFNASYDRYGGIWKDFVGFGLSIDLPVFNRNQGNIKTAKLGIEQNMYMEQQQRNIIHHEVATAYNNYVNTFNFYKKIEENSFLPELDNMQEIYTRNLLNKNISMLEYIDFMEAYKSNKQTVLTIKKNVGIQFEELQYIVGTDIK